MHDWTKMVNREFMYEREYFNMVQAIQKSIQIVHETAKQKFTDISAVIDHRENLGIIQNFMGDKVKFQHVLVSFLSSNLRFTGRNDKITMFVKVIQSQPVYSRSHNDKLKKAILKRMSERPDAEEINRIVASVNKKYKPSDSEIENQHIHLQLIIKNTALDKPEEEIKKLFQRKLGQERAQDFDIDLHMYNKIVENIGGEVEVKRKPEEGGEFILNFKTTSGSKKKAILSENFGPNDQSMLNFEFISASRNSSLKNYIEKQQVEDLLEIKQSPQMVRFKTVSM